jgi:hypothetical protein
MIIQEIMAQIENLKMYDPPIKTYLGPPRGVRNDVFSFTGSQVFNFMSITETMIGVYDIAFELRVTESIKNNETIYRIERSKILRNVKTEDIVNVFMQEIVY